MDFLELDIARNKDKKSDKQESIGENCQEMREMNENRSMRKKTANVKKRRHEDGERGLAMYQRAGNRNW